MRGRHGNHARGERNARFNMDERRITSHGYVAVRVAVDHPHGWGPKRLRSYRYAYEHVVVAMSRLGRPLLPLEVVHHRDGDKTNNAPSNLVITTRGDHAKIHDGERGRDRLGRFPAGTEDLRVRQWPEVTR